MKIDYIQRVIDPVQLLFFIKQNKCVSALIDRDTFMLLSLLKINARSYLVDAENQTMGGMNYLFSDKRIHPKNYQIIFEANKS